MPDLTRAAGDGDAPQTRHVCPTCHGTQEVEIRLLSGPVDVDCPDCLNGLVPSRTLFAAGILRPGGAR